MARSAMCSGRASCPVPKAHFHLDAAHRAWHKAAAHYGDLDAFSAAVNATLRSLRACVWVLQKQTRSLLDQEAWLHDWRQSIQEDHGLAWLVSSRGHALEASSLEPSSQAEVRLYAARGLASLAEFSVPPLLPTKEIALRLPDMQLPPPARRASLLAVERCWVTVDLPEGELLGQLADCYAALLGWLRQAHQPHHGHGGPPVPTIEADVEVVCMRVSSELRTVVLSLRTGRLQGPRNEWVEHDPEIVQKAVRPSEAMPAVQTLPKGDLDPLRSTARFFEDARRALGRDKHHPLAVHLFIPPHTWSPLTLQASAQQDPYIFWQDVAGEVRHAGAEAIVAVLEAGIPRSDARALVRFGEPGRQRREALVLIAETADGRHRTMTAPIHRRGDDLHFGRIKVEDDGRRWHFLEPIRIAWGKGRAAVGQDSEAMDQNPVP